MNINNLLDIKVMLSLIRLVFGERPDAELERSDAEDMSEDEGGKSIDSEKTENNLGEPLANSAALFEIVISFFSICCSRQRRT